MQEMTLELDRQDAAASGARENAVRQSQLGSGERSDRRRIWAFQRDRVDDLVTRKQIRCLDALKGHMDRLW